MEYAVEMGSGAMMYIPSFIQTGSGIRKFIWGGQTENKVISYAYLYFLKIRKVR
jgi:hypothetical protein